MPSPKRLTFKNQELSPKHPRPARPRSRQERPLTIVHHPLRLSTHRSSDHGILGAGFACYPSYFTSLDRMYGIFQLARFGIGFLPVTIPVKYLAKHKPSDDCYTDTPLDIPDPLGAGASALQGILVAALAEGAILRKVSKCKLV